MLLEDIEQRQAMLAAIVDSSEDAIISKDLNSIITSWNKAAERMFGYTEKEAIGKNISMLIPPDRQSEEAMIISSLKSGKLIEHYHTIRLHKSGRAFPISLTVSPIKNSRGTVVGASKIARDISKQKEAEETIKRYMTNLELINSVGKSISAELDISKILQTVTDATTKLSGAAFGAFFYNTSDAKGEAYLPYSVSGAAREAFEIFGTIPNTELFKKTFNGEGIFRSPDIRQDPRVGKNSPHNGMSNGHLPVVSYLAVPVISQSEVVIGGLFFGHPQTDIFTEQHEKIVESVASQAAIALDNAALLEQVQTLNAKKDQFIGFASHELKTPLTTIIGYLQLGENDPEQLRDFLPKINRQVKRLTAIISDLLDLSKIQAGKLELDFSRTSLLNLIRESIEAANLVHHNIICMLPPEDIFVLIDHQKMSQVLVNLLSNAQKYSPDNKDISLTASRWGDQIKISIADRGIGIEKTELAKIFSQFYRVSKSGNKAQGIGLGLYISKEIVENHGGNIWAESEEGKGSVFHVAFPINSLRRH